MGKHYEFATKSAKFTEIYIIWQGLMLVAKSQKFLFDISGKQGKQVQEETFLVETGDMIKCIVKLQCEQKFLRKTGKLVEISHLSKYY